MHSALFVAATALSAVVAAQNYSTSGPLSIDASQIESSLRQTWCRSQTYNCPLICDGRASANTCDSNTLNYTCTCAHGNTPNITNYQGTVPAYVCEQWIANCVDSNPNDLDAITGCRSVTCGNETVANTATKTTSSAAETSTATSSSGGGSEPTTTPTASASATAASATGSSAAAAIHAAQNYGTGVIVTALLAVFGFAL